MKRFGIIGFPLKTSFSCGYFNDKFKRENLSDHIYEMFPLNNIKDFVDLLKNNSDLCGLNVTFPYKKQIIPFLDALDESAAEVAAVNVIKFEKNGQLIGYNSDAIGFERSFLPFLRASMLGKATSSMTALVLGTGGAAAAVAYILRKNNIPFQFVSRNPQGDHQIHYNQLKSEGFGTAEILINATPLGMSPDVNACPEIPYHLVNQNFACYDLIYSPEKTLFLQKCEFQGAKIKNGLEMLHLQAERAWEIWKM
ncbi:shikimate 5-dehydrogenase [Bacteroidia bacterium]|nr:shikimate 5-dehydrogenase [Bacteroidia bacterium]